MGGHVSRVWDVLSAACLADKLGEGFGQLGAFDGAICSYEQLLEEPLVDLPPDLGWRCLVLGLAVARSSEGLFQDEGHVSESGVGSLYLGFGVGHGAGQAVHLGLHEVEGDGTGVVSLEKLGAFVVECGEALVGAFGAFVGIGNFACHCGADSEAEAVDTLGW